MPRVLFKQKQLLLGIIVLLAFFTQSLVPSGYMPKFGMGKVFEITICHGDGQQTVLVDKDMHPVSLADTKDSPNKEKKDGDKPCVFASVSSKTLVLEQFLFLHAESVTYERTVFRDGTPVTVSIPAKFYDGQAPPSV